tara:strand:- start:373 stop:801 length:429 start_codon:yes stop_codon:yes gene_type:complete
MTRRVWVYKGDEVYELGSQPQPSTHHVMGDIEPFRSPDGAVIMGRRQWREHLKATDSIEMNHADVKSAQENWNKRKQAHAEKLQGSEKTISALTHPITEVRESRRSDLNVEMANRLHGRPPPDRKTLIKLTLEQAKRMNRGR